MRLIKDFMKRNYMAEKEFRRIDREVESEMLADPVKRREYMQAMERKKYLNEVSKRVRKEMHMYG